MTWRVVVTPDAALNGVAMQIARRLDGGAVQALRFEQTVDVIPEGVAMPGPSMALTDDLAMALLDALADHYGNTTGGRQQRADYEHERGRVDRLIGVVEGALMAAQQRPALRVGPAGRGVSS
ncbi:hypothetical protein [Micromonospora sp. WMMD737]|uniref:hypothetical protein n=1 Tax=Micromonospora sp. WMMD737 TaxID=3404113 RepID=UPI003B948CA7